VTGEHSKVEAVSEEQWGEGFAFFRWRVLKNDCCLISCWACQQEWAGGQR
jgi:hypothetical protein